RQREPTALGKKHNAVRRLTQSPRAAHDGIEDRLLVRWGARDDAQDVAGRRLLLERDAQLGVARLQLGEQADVLDGNDGLVGERLDELDLLVAERLDVASPQSERADRLSVAQHRDREDRAESELAPQRARVFRIFADVGDLDDSAIED